METLEQELYSGETAYERVRRESAEDRNGLALDHRRMREEVRFALEQKQYRDQGDERHRAGEIMPTSTILFRLWRYKKGQIRQKFPVHISCEPQDDEADPAAAASFKRYLENEVVHQKWKLYAETRDRWIGSALAMRAGCYRWDFVPYLGDGEIRSRLIDPTNLSWPRGFLTFHDPECPRMFEVFRMPVNAARRIKDWQGTSGLKADDGGVMDHQGAGAWPAMDQAGRVKLGGEQDGSGHDDLVGDNGFFTGVMGWYRFEGNVKLKPRQLDPMDRYMVCQGAACDFQTPPQGDVHEDAPGFQYPAAMPGACPTCGGDMIRRDSQPVTEGDKTMARGKRLVIIALNGSVTEPLYDGSWPCPTARSFPYAWLTANRFPHMRLPESDVSLNWTGTVGLNFTLATIYRQVHRARGIWLLPDDGIKDRNGYRYDLGDDQDDVAFYSGQDMPPNGVQNIPAPSVPPELFQLYNTLTNDFRSNEGSSDISLSPENSKDIPVGTVEQLVETGNIPIDDFGQDVYEAEGLSFGILADYVRWFYTSKKTVRYYNDQGVIEHARMRGCDLPDVDVIVGSGPSLSQARKEDIEAYQQLVNLPGPRRRRLAKLLGIDPQFVNEMDQDDQATMVWQANLERQAQAVAMQNGGASPPNAMGAPPAPNSGPPLGGPGPQPQPVAGSVNGA